LVGILGAITLAMGVTAAAKAAVTVDIHGAGSNVVAITSGSLDLTGLTSLGLYYLQTGIQASDGYVGTGAGSYQFPGDPITLQNGYSGLTGPAAFGSGPFIYANSGSGAAFALNGSFFGPTYVFVPNGYVSGTALTSSATYLGQTIASLGLTVGSYVYTSGTDTVTVNIAAVPEPAAWAMMLAGFGIIGGSIRHLRRSAMTAHAA
jgi:hypothetical protein